MVNNSLVQKNGNNEARTISQFLSGEKVQKMLISSLSTEKAKQKFISNVVSLVSVRPELQKCDFSTIVSGAMLATSLDLPLSPSLGFCALVPYEDKKKKRFVATFIMQYKGYIQLAIRSGYYADIDVREVREGEYLGRDPFSGKPRFKFIEDDDEAAALPIIGYMAYFEYLNGFKKVIYWSKEKMLQHADRYSPAFSLNATKGQYPKVSYADFEAGNYPKEDEWKYSSFWYKDFQSMAFKTMIRQLISKWGVMSTEMQSAYDEDSQRMAEEKDSTIYTAEDASDDFFDGTEEIVVQESEPEIQEEEVKATTDKPKKTRKSKESVQEDFFNAQ